MIDVAVSGRMIGADMQKLPKTFWDVVSWNQVLSDYPDSKVLKRKQTMPIPNKWPQYTKSCF